MHEDDASTGEVLIAFCSKCVVHVHDSHVWAMQASQRMKAVEL